MTDPSRRLFERCPRCLRTWEAFPVYRCRACETTFCGCCEEEDLPSKDAQWLIVVWAEIRDVACPACTSPVSAAGRIGVLGKAMKTGTS